MRKLILSIIFVLCLCFQSSAMSPAFLQAVCGSAPAADDYCSSCIPGDPTDIRCEDAEGTNTIETGATDFTTAQCSDWTATIDTDAYLYENSHSGTLACTDKGDYAIEYYVVDTVDDGSEEAYLLKDIVDSNSLYLNFYFNLVSHSLEGTKYVGLAQFCYDDACVFRLSIIEIYNDGGTLKLRMNHRNGSATYTNNLGTTEISTGTWYRVGLTWVAATTSSVTLNGSAEIAAGVEGVANNPVKAVIIGSSNVGTNINNDPVTIQVDNIGIDDDTMPGACPE